MVVRPVTVEGRQEKAARCKMVMLRLGGCLLHSRWHQQPQLLRPLLGLLPWSVDLAYAVALFVEHWKKLDVLCSDPSPVVRSSA